MYPAAQHIHLRELALGLAGLGLFLLALGLLARWSGAVGLGLAALGGEYAVLFAAESAHLDRTAPVYAIGFLLVAELAFWSIEPRVPAWADPVVFELRLARLAVTCALAGIVAGLVVVDSTAISGGGGFGLEALGVGAAVGSLLLLAGLVRRSV